MIVLSQKTLELIKAESGKSPVHVAVAEGQLTHHEFSPELRASLDADAKTDGTGDKMVPQIASLVGQILGIGLRPLIESHPGLARVIRGDVADLREAVEPAKPAAVTAQALPVLAKK